MQSTGADESPKFLVRGRSRPILKAAQTRSQRPCVSQMRGSPVGGSLGLVGQVFLTGRNRWSRAASRKRKQLQDGEDEGMA